MNALIFLVPEDIVDIRPRLVSFCYSHANREVLADCLGLDHDLRG